MTGFGDEFAAIQAGQRVVTSALTTCAASILQAAGLWPGDAVRMAELLVFAQESGIDSHGLAHLPAYIAGIARGSLKAKPSIRVQSDFPAAAVLDADQAPGALAGLVACDEVIARAKKCGVAAVAVRNSAHFGAASAFAARMADEDLVSIVLSNASPTVAPRGGATPLFGTNPVAAGFPSADGPPVILDFATTVGSRGRIRKAALEGKPIPVDWALDRDGHPTTDAKAALAGTMQALGGAKGAILPLLVEMLCVTLSGGSPGADVLTPDERSDRPRAVSHLFIAMDGRAFGGGEEVAGRVAAVTRLVEAATPLDPNEPPRMPGARAAAQRNRARREGVLVTPTLRKALEDAHSLANRMRASAFAREDSQQ